MLRFPNPGSNIDNILKIFQELYFELFEFQPFSLDHMSHILATKNLATSSGFIGKEALKRSTREDRSRDPMYNQSKMYAEAFRFLGWIHPTENGSLSYQFTYLGAHATQIMEDPKPFIRECLIGIAYPTEILGVKGGYILRPFFTILKTMLALDGYISRDEMIIGPLSLNDDTSEENFIEMVKKLKAIRKEGSKALQAALDQVTGSTGIILSQATRENNTRFPLAALLWSDWAITQRKKDHYSRSQIYYCLTEFGYEYSLTISSYVDIRMSNIHHIYNSVQDSLIRLSFFQMLERSGFDISSETPHMKSDLKNLQKINCDIQASNLLFSPYQELASDTLTKYFPSLIPKDKKEIDVDWTTYSETTAHTSGLTEIMKFNVSETATQKKDSIDLIQNIVKELEKGEILDKCISKVVDNFSASSQNQFYPLIANIFKNLGFNCINPSQGVNYSRWDAIIIDDEHSIPIEIKSPAEEKHISMKAVRQALENKIILLSRKPYVTTNDTSTLVVGYYLPNNRSEVEGLIKDINITYGFRIGVIDLYTLIKMTVLSTISSGAFDKSKLENLNGYISIETI
jgi:hypothetical protein